MDRIFAWATLILICAWVISWIFEKYQARRNKLSSMEMAQRIVARARYERLK